MNGRPRPSRSAASICAGSSPRWQRTPVPVTTTVRAGSRMGHGLAPFAAADSMRLDGADAQGAPPQGTHRERDVFEARPARRVLTSHAIGAGTIRRSRAGLPSIRPLPQVAFLAAEGNRDALISAEFRNLPLARWDRADVAVSERGASQADEVRHRQEQVGVADVWRPRLRGRRAVREDRRHGVRGSESQRRQEFRDGRHPARAAQCQRQRRVRLRLLHLEADESEGWCPQSHVRAAEPRQQDVGHHVMYEPPNRGNKTWATLGRFPGGNDPGSVTDPAALDNAFFMPRGYTIVFSGWDQAAGTNNANFNTTIDLSKAVAHNPDGSTITGPGYEYIVTGAASFNLTYPAVTNAQGVADKSHATLTHRIHLVDVPKVLASSAWDYTKSSPTAMNGTAIKLNASPDAAPCDNSTPPKCPFVANDIY